MKELVNEDLTNTAIIAIMATSIAYSLAIIADNMAKGKKDKENKDGSNYN